MIADTMLSRLDGVRRTGADRWLALCPAHDDKRPSLSVREIDNRVLVHCWADCTVGQRMATRSLWRSYPTPNHHGKMPLRLSCAVCSATVALPTLGACRGL
jgi:hypothetical protein